MSFYLVFNNFAQYFEPSEPTDCIEDIKAANNNLVEKPFQDAVADIQTILSTKPENTIFPNVESSLKNLVFTNDSDKTAVPASQIVPTFGLETELSKTIAEEQNSKTETGDVGQNVIYEDFQSLLKKFEVSLQYRYDYADVFNSNREKENSQNFSRIIEKNLKKQRAEQQEDFEKFSQEKQAESLRESFKQKRFAAQLQK